MVKAFVSVIIEQYLQDLEVETLLTQLAQCNAPTLHGDLLRAVVALSGPARNVQPHTITTISAFNHSNMSSWVA
jgi:hypothetical protein